MLKLAKVLTGVTLTLLLFLLVAVFGVALRVELLEYETIPARSSPEQAAELIETAQRGEMASDLYRRPTSSNLDNYQLVKIRIGVRNIGLLPAEWVQLRVAPETADVALFSSGEVDVPGFGMTREITATLLAEAESSAQHRSMRLEYYVFGRRLEAVVPVG